MMDKKERLHAGHRERMREKFTQYGREVFHTHELLEMLLFHAVRQRNTNGIAKNLMLRFGTLDAVLSASREELIAVEGVGEKIAEMLIEIGRINPQESDASSEKEGARAFVDYRETGEFFIEYFAERKTPGVVLMLLDNKMQLLDLKCLYNTDYESAAIKTAPFIDAAMSVNASVAIIAHNHPYGPTFPTQGDFATNSMICEAFAAVGIPLVEHYIVSGRGFVGFMTNLSAAFSQYRELEKFLRSKTLQYE